MPYDLFWHGPISAYLQFRGANELRKEEKNHEAWLNGSYVLRAVSHVLGGKKSPYPEKPFEARKPLTPEQIKKNEETREAIMQHNKEMRKIREEQAVKQQQKIIAKLEANSHGGTDH